MEKIIDQIKETIISGIILFLPVFVLMAIFKNVYSKLYSSGHKLMKIFGFNDDEDKKWIPLATLFLFMVILYLFGLMVKFAAITKMKEWIENNVLLYIPTYSKYKAKMMAKLQPEDVERQPILVEMNGGWKPGFLINSDGEKSTVFLPTTPDIDYGEVWIMENHKVSKIDLPPKEFKNSLLLSGKGMKTNKVQFKEK